MRKVWAVVGVVAVAVGMSAAPVEAKTKPPKVPTTEQLQAALLALEDMPTGFAASPLTSQTTGPCNGPTIKTLTDAGASAPGVNVSFSKNETVGPLVSEGLVAYPTVTAAKRAFATVRDVYAKCPAYDSVSTSGNAYHIENAAESFPKAGDQTAAIRSVIHPQSDLTSVAAEGDIIFIRNGNVLVEVTQAGLALDGGLTTQMVGKAMKRLGRLGS